MTAVATEAPPQWWQGVGSPGVAGYIVADLVAVGALALLLPLGVSPDVADYGVGVMVVLIWGGLGSIPLALIGCPVVHSCCLRVRSQAVHVLAAGLVGFWIVVLPIGVSSGDWLAPEGLFLGTATALGRAAVIPLARARMRS